MVSKHALHQELTAAIDESLDRPTFVELYQRVIEAFDIKDYEVARVEKIAIGTAIRWRTGIAAPRKKYRPSALLALLHIIERRSMSASELLCDVAETSERKGEAVYPYPMAAPVQTLSGLAGKRAKLLKTKPDGADGYPAGLPEETREVMIIDDSPSPYGAVRVSTFDDPSVIGLALMIQLQVAD